MSIAPESLTAGTGTGPVTDPPRRHRLTIHDPETFRAIVEQEKARSDRSGSPYALVTFAVSTPSDGAMILRHVAEYVRATDQLGILGQSAAVLLWDTDLAGVRQFVRKIRPVQPLLKGMPDVFVYPDPQSVTRGAAVADRVALGHETVKGESDCNDFETIMSRVEQALVLTESALDTLAGESADWQCQAPQSIAALFAQPVPRWKRALDVVCASLGMIALAPLFATVAALIKLTSPGPVLFLQQRSGLGGRPFTMLKFRSMVVDAEAQKSELLKNNEQDGPAFKMEDDPRITWIGHIIRKTSIDELPQLWNVIKGDMSIVGPRPLPIQEAAACQPWQRRRLEITPGLTCIWQVQDRRTKIPFDEWARMDIRYMDSRNPRRDLSLVVRTLSTIFGRKGS